MSRGVRTRPDSAPQETPLVHRWRSAACLVFAAWLLGHASPLGGAIARAQDAGGDAHASPTPERDAGASGAPTDTGAPTAADASAGASTEAEEPELTGEHRPTVEAHVTPTEGLVTGDAFELELRVSVPSGDDVAVPEQSFAPFEILEKHRSVEDGESGRRTFVFRLRLLALAPGDQHLDPVSLRVVTGEGVIGHAQTEGFDLHVESALGNEPHAEPKPPTEPVSVMVDDYTLAWIAGSLATIVLVVLLTLWFARWWSRREREAAPPPPPRPPWELALARLETLRSGRAEALESGRGAEWVDGLSDAMRDYLGGRYGFDGLECTTDEVIGKLRRARLVGISVAEVTALLGECDLVKFADVGVDEEQLDRLISEAFRMVRATIPHMGSRPAGQGAGQSDQASAATDEQGAAPATAEPESATAEDPQESLRRRWGPPEPEPEAEADTADRQEPPAADASAEVAETPAEVAVTPAETSAEVAETPAETAHSEPPHGTADDDAADARATEDPTGADDPEGGAP